LYYFVSFNDKLHYLVSFNAKLYYFVSFNDSWPFTGTFLWEMPKIDIFISKFFNVLCNMSFTEHLPEDGHNICPKHVGSYVDYNITNLHIYIWTVGYSFIPLACAECDNTFRSQVLLLFLTVIYVFMPLFSTNYSSILPHFISPSISWFTSWSCWFQIHIRYFILCTCLNQRNLCSLIVSVMVGFLTIA
jgi:hypothetical protein